MRNGPDYRHMLDVVTNRRPARLPVYEHIISPGIMEQVMNSRFAGLLAGDTGDQHEFFRQYSAFFREMTYDTVSFEACLISILPDSGAIMGGRPGPIQTRQDFDRFPWDELHDRFWEMAEPQFIALRNTMPEGMKAVGGIGNGVFEISEDLVGFEYLCYLQADDPELFADVYRHIGELMLSVWKTFLERHADTFMACRFGDDLGFKTATLLQPEALRQHVFPQYRRVIQAVREADKAFLWHSCGNIFAVMEDAIDAGIQAKHSNEDAIAPFDEWIARYGDRIGLLGGIDLDILCQRTPAKIADLVTERGTRYRNTARGYALGSGNSIPDYVPVDGYLAMIEAARRIRAQEAG